MYLTSIMFLTLSFDLQYVKSANCKFYFYYHYQPIRIKHILTLYIRKALLILTLQKGVYAIIQIKKIKL